MKSEGLCPDAITYTYILKACGSTQNVDKIHDEIVSKGLLGIDVVLGNALVDMYAKSGEVAKAACSGCSILDCTHCRICPTGAVQRSYGLFSTDAKRGHHSSIVLWNALIGVLWNALIGGYAQQGLAEEALVCFQWMQCDCTSPDAVTFVCVLKACSHSGQVYFREMRENYGITLDKEHHTCMIDLFGCAGLFNKATTVIKEMSSFDHSPVWSALLGASRKWGNVKLGRLAFERAVQLNESDAGSYVLMADIYAAADMQKD